MCWDGPQFSAQTPCSSDSERTAPDRNMGAILILELRHMYKHHAGTDHREPFLARAREQLYGVLEWSAVTCINFVWECVVENRSG